jgi:hypothetical protein
VEAVSPLLDAGVPGVSSGEAGAGKPPRSRRLRLAALLTPFAPLTPLRCLLRLGWRERGPFPSPPRRAGSSVERRRSADGRRVVSGPDGDPGTRFRRRRSAGRGALGPADIPATTPGVELGVTNRPTPVAMGAVSPTDDDRPITPRGGTSEGAALSTTLDEVSTAATGGSEERNESRESRAWGLPGTCGAVQPTAVAVRGERARRCPEACRAVR